jgi:leucyl/phenylalanyl-tRNA--protein transferase
VAGARQFNLNPEVVLAAYTHGAFPMTDPDGITRWYTADPRGVLPLEQFHCPRTLRQIVRQHRFDVRINTNFEATMRACMTVTRPDADGSWISDDLIGVYTTLHRGGFAHSVEAYERDELVGGLYGVSIGGAFFGESMFHRAANASKVCLVHLVQRLIDRNFALLDTQMVTSHMRQFGTIEIPVRDYMMRLEQALRQSCNFA